MAHEVDEAPSRKRIIRWENGRPVYAEPSTESDEDDENAADTETVGHEEHDASDE